MGLWVTLPPRDGERVLAVKTGCTLVPGTSLALVGGILVLTNQRLYQGPLNTRVFGRLLSLLGEAVGPPGTTEVVDVFSSWANKATAVPLGSVVSVDPVGRAVLRVTTEDGRQRRFGVAATWRSPVWSRNNTPHRDEMVSLIRAAISVV
ncbi:hypothetical protein ACQUSR_33950 [Streptomyces sp. P1-3]|uniref:hypothetical protein n=1 Tax=Streptomyces sp. P1-3 TaxID=3421658 RepID=UPI003D36DEFF